MLPVFVLALQGRAAVCLFQPPAMTLCAVAPELSTESNYKLTPLTNISHHTLERLYPMVPAHGHSHGPYRPQWGFVGPKQRVFSTARL